MQKIKEYAGLMALGVMVVALLMGVADNRYPNDFGYSLTGPGTGTVTIVQHDTNELTQVIRQLKAEAAGTVVYVSVDGTTNTEDMLAGESINQQIKQIKDTGTTLTDAQMTGRK